MTAELRHGKALSSALSFANWCRNHAIDPTDAAELITLAKRAHAAGERAASYYSDRDRKAEQRTGERFEAKATSLGYGVSWPGLWPVLAKDGQDVYLPSL